MTFGKIVLFLVVFLLVLLTVIIAVALIRGFISTTFKQNKYVIQFIELVESGEPRKVVCVIYADSEALAAEKVYDMYGKKLYILAVTRVPEGLEPGDE